VVGADSREALDVLRALYEPIIEQSFPTQIDPRPKVTVPFVTTDLVSAEMIKYAANAFLATKVSFIRRRCPDITRAREALGWEPRVSAREGLQKTLSWFAERSAASPAKR
jgi:UDPglucose 6-dehydrogenase